MAVCLRTLPRSSDATELRIDKDWTNKAFFLKLCETKSSLIVCNKEFLKKCSITTVQNILYKSKNVLFKKKKKSIEFEEIVCC